MGAISPTSKTKPHCICFRHLHYELLVLATTISDLGYYTRLLSDVPTSSLAPLQFILCTAARAIFIIYRTCHLPLFLGYNPASLPCPTRPHKEWLSLPLGPCLLHSCPSSPLSISLAAVCSSSILSTFILVVPLILLLSFRFQPKYHLLREIFPDPPTPQGSLTVSITFPGFIFLNHWVTAAVFIYLHYLSSPIGALISPTQDYILPILLIAYLQCLD